MVSLALLLLSVVPPDPVVRDRCDLIDSNTFYNEEGQVVLKQIIFWQDYGDAYHTRAWRLDKGQFYVARDYDNREWVVRWMDEGTLREVRAKTHDFTHCQHDDEIRDRELLPVSQRRPLKSKH